MASPKKVFFISLIGIMAALIVYRFLENNNSNTPRKGPVAAMKVKGKIVEPREFQDEITLSGTIEANEQVDIRSEVSGIIQKIHFDEGQRVSKGQILFQIQNDELQAQKNQIVTQRNLAKENERRAKLLLEKEAISQEEYDIASSNYRSSEAQLQLINTQIEKTNVRAPFSGTLGLRAVSLGAFVTPTTEIVKLVNNNEVKITFTIPENYASEISIGQELDFSTSTTTSNLKAKIYAIEPVVDVQTRSLKVRALAENKDNKLIPGTFAHIALALKSNPEAILVPSEALIPVQNGKKLFKASQGKAKEVFVKSGTRTEKEVVILEGLSKGDTLLISGIMSLREGADIKIELVK